MQGRNRQKADLDDLKKQKSSISKDAKKSAGKISQLVKPRRNKKASATPEKSRKSSDDTLVDSHDEPKVDSMESIPDTESSSKLGKLANFVFKIIPFAVAGLILVAIFLLSTIKEVNVYVNGDFIEDTSSEYHVAAKEVMDSSFLGSWKPFFRTSKLADQLSTPLILVSNVDKDSRLLSSTVDLYINESRPSLVYVHEQTGNRYLVDADGIAYQVIADDQKSINSVEVIDKTPFPASVNQTVINVRTVDFINNFNGLVQRDSPVTTPVAYTINSSERFLELTLSNKPYYLILSTDRPVDSQFLAYKGLIEHLEGNDRDEPVSYIDLRIDGQVNYK